MYAPLAAFYFVILQLCYKRPNFVDSERDAC